MKKIIKNSGLVIKTSDYLENACLATIYTKKDIGTYLIKGAKKLNSSTRKLSIPLTKISFNHTLSSGISVLTEGEVLDNYTIIKDDLNKYHAASVILEKIAYFAPQVTNHELLYDFTLKLLEKIKTTAYYHAVIMIFEIKLLYLVGVAPSFNRCPICNKACLNGALLVSSGGFICNDCQFMHSFSLNINDSLMFKKIYVTKIDDVDEEFLKNINGLTIISDIIDDYYAYHLDFESKAKKILKKIG